VKCTHCGRDFDPLRDQRFCPFCGSNTEPTQGGDKHSWESELEPEIIDHDTGYQETEGYCPWEDQDRLGFVQGLVMTVRESWAGPTAFFAQLPIRGGIANPLLYALIVSTTASLVHYIWGLLLGDPILSKAELSGPIIIFAGLMIPVGILLGIAIWSGVLHLSLTLTGGANRDFEATFRVVCYASGPDLFYVIPYIGWAIAIVWKVYLTIVGLREVHKIATGSAVLAFTLPAVFCCGVTFGLVMLVLTTIGMVFA
jgi:hypothetical protein